MMFSILASLIILEYLNSRITRDWSYFIKNMEKKDLTKSKIIPDIRQILNSVVEGGENGL